MANDITIAEVSEIENPKLRKLLKRVVREMELSVEKVAANHAHPNEFPLPADPNSTERILAGRFQTLNKNVKDRSADRALQRINAPREIRVKMLGDLANVNLKTDASVGSQVRAMKLPADLKLTKNQLFGTTNGTAAANETAAALPQFRNLEFRLHKVKCLDETGGSFAERFGNDEIDLGGTSVDESGDAKVISKFRVGSHFDDGEQVTFNPPRPFTRFNLTEGTAFPKSYFVTMVLAEADQGGLPDFLNKLLTKIKEKVIAALIAAFGSLTGISGGPVGAVIGMAVGFVVGKVFEFIKSVWEDDIFPPVTARINIPSLQARFPNGSMDSPDSTATFTGHDGKYQVTYDWRVFA